MNDSNGTQKEFGMQKEIKEAIAEEWFFPIFSEEIRMMANECDFYPIYAAELCDDSTEETLTEDGEISNAQADTGTGYLSFVAQELIDKLKKDYVAVSASETEIEHFIESAVANGEIESGNREKGAEYAKQMAMNLEFRLMLNSDENKIVTDQMMKDLASELFGKEPVAAAPAAPIENVAVQDDLELLPEDDEAEKQEEQETQEEQEEQEEQIDAWQMLAREMTPSTDAAMHDNLYDALRASESYIPTKKIINGDNQEEKVIDLDFIKSMEEKLPAKEKILYACDFMQVGVFEENNFKTKSKGFIEVKKGNRFTESMLFIITETKLIGIGTLRGISARDFVVDKSEIVSVNGIYFKCSRFSVKYSQIQVKLKNGKWFLLNKYFYGQSAWEQYLDDFKKMIGW